ncbi:MAG: lipoyl(octanoyl) transferase LipB [Candidatus Zixiibacteriota bacterium]|nr:MAG: lipoyl(octanoyl) transferase LipB [candidate division Zixibacteria bacterium]
MGKKGPGKLFLLNLGMTKYKVTWNLQKKLVALRARSVIPDCLIVTEHEPVITMGRGTDPGNLLEPPEEITRKGIDLFKVERGGDITFHGPGQTILYPIIDLRRRGRDVHKYLRDLESVAIAALNEIGLDANTKDGLTGIWVHNHKLGAIGVAVSRWIAYHGLALNVADELDHFRLIRPCGIIEYPVGSISGMLGRRVAMNQINNLLIASFANTFRCFPEAVEDITALTNIRTEQDSLPESI